MSRFRRIDPDLLAHVREHLVAVVEKHADEWVEWGVVEFEFARDSPAEFRRVIELRQGHRAQAERGQLAKHGHMTSWYLANQILTRQPGVKCRMGECTGAWDIWDPNGEISFWTVPDAEPPWANRLRWDAYCAQGRTGLPGGLAPIDYMAYVPDPPPPS